MESYRGVVFEPNLMRMAMIRLRPTWAGRSSMWGGSLRWMANPAPSDVEQIPDWVPLQPILSGICGSDTAAIFGKSSAYLAPVTSFPAVLGHEILARVVQSRPGRAEGTRVVVDPTLGCNARREAVPCSACASGFPYFCEKRQDPKQGAGMLLGYHHRWPGGFATKMWAPCEQCWVVPEGMSDDRAVLTEPLATVLAGMELVSSKPSMRVLVIGAGTIGLLATWACHQLFSPTVLHVVSRYRYQADWATVLGADATSADPGFVQSSLEVLGQPAHPGQFGAPTYYPKGYDLVVDAVGTKSSIRQGLEQTKPGGQFLQLGGSGEIQTDLTPLWSRGIHWLGTYGYRGRSGISTFPLALSWLKDAEVPIEGLVTHRYPLDQYAQALETLRDRRVPTIKVVLTQPKRIG